MYISHYSIRQEKWWNDLETEYRRQVLELLHVDISFGNAWIPSSALSNNDSGEKLGYVSATWLILRRSFGIGYFQAEPLDL